MKFTLILSFLSSLGLHAGILYSGYAIFSSLNNTIDFSEQQNSAKVNTYIFDVSLEPDFFPSTTGASREALAAKVDKQENLLASGNLEIQGNSGSLQSYSNKSGSPIEASMLGITPYYPRLSRERGEEGRSVYKVELDETQTIRKVELLRSSGYQRLDQAGAETLENAKVPFLHPGSEEVALSYKLDK